MVRKKTNDPLAGLPPWAQKLAQRYYTRTVSTFVVYGAIIVLIARFQPGGILTLINRLWANRKKTAEPSTAAGATHAP